MQNNNQKNFFDLVKYEVDDISIVEDGSGFNCRIVDREGVAYDGFLLGKSPKGKAQTICEVNFQRSSESGKYQPRLTFKRTDENFATKKVPNGGSFQRISFHSSRDGYGGFFKMVTVLSSFKEVVDIGIFEGEYRAVSSQEVIRYLEKKEDYEGIISGLGENPLAAINSSVKLNLLKSYKKKVEEFIEVGSSETEVQKWIDQEDRSYVRERCMIFGLEFIDHIREGSVSGNRYDILTRIGSESSEERVLFELKSPSEEVFSVIKKNTKNGVKGIYSLSSALSRAIPQILEYKSDLEQKRSSDSELQKVGITTEVKVAKCIIVIGQRRQGNPRWEENFRNIRMSLASGLEIWTYTDLLNKIEAVIENLERQSSDQY